MDMSLPREYCTHVGIYGTSNNTPDEMKARIDPESQTTSQYKGCSGQAVFFPANP